MGIPLVSVTSIFREHFRNIRDHDTAMGVVFIGPAVGMTVFPPITELLIDTYGWRNTIILMGLSCLNISVGSLLFKPGKKRLTVKGTVKYNQETEKATSSFLKACCETIVQNTGLTAIRQIPILSLYLASFLLWGIAYSGWTLFLFSYAISLGYSAGVASVFSAVGGIGTLAGRCTSILLFANQWPSSYLQFVLLSAGGCIGLSSYPFMEDYWAMIFLSFVVGFFLGSPPLACVLITKSITTECPELYRGALGLQFLSQGIGLFAGGPITGIVLF